MCLEKWASQNIVLTQNPYTSQEVTACTEYGKIAWLHWDKTVYSPLIYSTYIGGPQPQFVDRYQSMVHWELGCMSGGQIHKAPFVQAAGMCVKSFPPLPSRSCPAASVGLPNWKGCGPLTYIMNILYNTVYSILRLEEILMTLIWKCKESANTSNKSQTAHWKKWD